MLDARYDLRALTDVVLEERLHALVRRERGVTAELLAHLAEVDARRLCGGKAEASLFPYCVRVLGYSEDEASKRIQAARTARAFPVIYELVAGGQLTQTVITRVGPHLTAENHVALLGAVKGKTLRQVEEVLAAWFPKPDVPAVVRKLPARAAAAHQPSAGAKRGAAVDASRGIEVVATGATVGGTCQSATGSFLRAGALVRPGSGTAHGGTAASHVVAAAGTRDGGVQASPRADGVLAAVGGCGSAQRGEVHATAAVPFRGRGDRGSVAPLAPDRYRVQLTVSGATRDKLLRAQALLRHSQPDGDLAVVIDRALSLLVEDLERRKFGKLKGSRASVSDSACVQAIDHSAPTTESPGSGAVDSASGGTGSTATAIEVALSRSIVGGRTAPVTEPTTAASTSAGRAEVVSKPPAATSDGRPGQTSRRSRGIPRSIRRAVSERDGQQCTFVGPDGRRCQERAFLEFHHLDAFALGGGTTVENLTLRCRQHNLPQGVLDFGAEWMRRAVEEARGGRAGGWSRGAVPTPSAGRNRGALRADDRGGRRA